MIGSDVVAGRDVSAGLIVLVVAGVEDENGTEIEDDVTAGKELVPCRLVDDDDESDDDDADVEVDDGAVAELDVEREVLSLATVD